MSLKPFHQPYDLSMECYPKQATVYVVPKAAIRAGSLAADSTSANSFAVLPVQQVLSEVVARHEIKVARTVTQDVWDEGFCTQKGAWLHRA